MYAKKLPLSLIAFKTLGCKANRAESDLLQEKLSCAGHAFVDAKSKADIYIINTCAVTNEADKKSRQAIRALAHARPEARIFVFGCGVRAHRDFYKNMPEVDFATTEPNEILKKFDVVRCHVTAQLNVSETIRRTSTAIQRTRAVIKIQDGCNNSCSYCIIRLVRGREKSYSMKEILSRINKKLMEGYKEIVLTGINLTSWRGTAALERDGGKEPSWRGGDGGGKAGWGCDFADLVRAILNNTTVSRLRISSVEPESVDEKFARILKNPRVCNHIHLPLQSGSDRILKLMRRKYSTKIFEKARRAIIKANPNTAITTDVIVGFPSETEKDFKDTINFCKKIKFAKIHVFPYSKRKNTPAAVMPNQIDPKIKIQRAKILRDLSDKIRNEFIKKNSGKIYEVLFESHKKNLWRGWTTNYIKVNVESREQLANKIRKVKLVKAMKGNEALGELEK